MKLDRGCSLTWVIYRKVFSLCDLPEQQQQKNPQRKNPTNKKDSAKNLQLSDTESQEKKPNNQQLC